MVTNTVRAIHSVSYQEVSQFFAAHEPPFTINDVNQFNAIYREAYPALTPTERRRGEEWVDYLIENVEHPELIGKIYGVV